MLNRNKIIVMAVSFMVASLFYLILPQRSLAQGGCCRTADNAVCLGCNEGCAATENYCEAQGGLFIGGTEACVTEFGDCGSLPESTTGCCLRTEGACAEDLTYDQCFSANNGQFWVANDACSEVPECQEARPVPTINQWGMIVLAIVLGVGAILYYRRRTVKA